MGTEELRSRILESLDRAGIRPPGPSGRSYRAEEGQAFARYFDHTLLKPEATAERFDRLFQEASEHGVASVCVPANRVVAAVAALSGSAVEVCTVVGFPLGYEPPEAKARAVEVCRRQGCTEFDMVIPIGVLKDGDYPRVYSDIRTVVEAAGEDVVKVIIETALLTDEEKAAACLLSAMAGAAMVKTSTGFADSGAAVADIRLMREVVGEKMGIKAAGGIRDRDFARQCIDAGADRLGASRTVQILAES